jgi:hypothetical protein
MYSVCVSINILAKTHSLIFRHTFEANPVLYQSPPPPHTHTHSNIYIPKQTLENK